MQFLKLHRTNSEETKLVQECIEGKLSAQYSLYERYKNAMFTTALRITGNRDDAHDVLQDAFLDIFQSIEEFRFESTLGSWIKTFVVRKAIRQLKKNHINDSLETIEKLVDNSSFDSIDGQYLEKAILALPDSARAVFLLIEVEGYKHAETAEILGTSEGTTKSQLNYAKKLLRKKLSEFQTI